MNTFHNSRLNQESNLLIQFAHVDLRPKKEIVYFGVVIKLSVGQTSHLEAETLGLMGQVSQFAIVVWRLIPQTVCFADVGLEPDL